MIRVHLTAQDLLRTRFASHPAPLIELGHALAALHRRDPVLASWRRSAVTGFPRAARPLLELVPPSATGPMFLDPVSTSLGEGLDLVQSTPSSFVQAELDRLTGPRRQPLWVQNLADRDPEAWRDLDHALRVAYQHLLVADWPRVWSAFRAELAWRGRLIAERGVQAALSTLHPSISWSGPVLQIRALTNLEV